MDLVQEKEAITTFSTSFDESVCIPRKYQLTFRNDPEFCFLRDYLLNKAKNAQNIKEDEEFSKSNNNTLKKRISFYEYHKLHPFPLPCDDLVRPISIEEFQFLCKEIPDPMWNSTFCLERILRLLNTVPDPLATTTIAIAGQDEEDIPDAASSNSNSKELLENRINELYKFYLIKSPAGIYIQDANTLKNILLVSNELIPSFPFLESFVGKLFQQLFKGFRVQNLSYNVYLDGLTQILNEFGYLIRSCPSTLSHRLIELLEHWILLYDESKMDTCSVKVKIPKEKSLTSDFAIPNDKKLDCRLFFNCLQESELGPRLIQYIIETTRQTSCHVEFYGNVIGLLTKLIDCSNEIRAAALAFPIIEPMLLQLQHPDEGCKLLCRVIGIVYSLLAKSNDDINETDKTSNTIAPCSPQAFEILLFRFLQRLRHVTSKYLVNLRNDVAFVIYLLIKNIPMLRASFERHAFVIAGIVANNVISQENIPFVLDSTIEDLELLKILIWILKFIIEEDKHAAEIICMYEFPTVLVRILIGPCSILDNYEQDEEILLQMNQCAWTLLNYIGTKWPTALLVEDVVDALLNVLKIYGEFGQLEISTVTIILDVLRILLSNEDKHDEILDYFVNKDATVIFTRVLGQLLKKELGIDDEPILCNCLICCSICASYHQKERDIFLQENGVKILALLVYKLIYTQADKRHINPIVQISVAECVWRSLSGSLESLEMFVAYEGIFHLLDLLEIAAGPAAQLHILNCLVELCEYFRCVGQLLHWRRRSKTASKRLSHSDEYRIPGSRNGTQVRANTVSGDVFGDAVLDADSSLSALLCELWREEETRFGCARDKRGVITSLDNPLNSEFSKQQFKEMGAQKTQKNTNNHNGSNNNGIACLDLIGSIRPKIYLLAKKIVETTNTEATLFGSLGLQNQITMQVIINFIDLKRSEVWLEMIQQLQSDGIQLVDTDCFALKRFLKIAHNKVCTVVDTQRYLIHRAEEHSEMHERQFYSVIQQCHLQNHLAAITEADSYARTTNYFLLVEKRLWQKAQLQKAMKIAENTKNYSKNSAVTNNNNAARIHRTTDDTLNVTVWPGRNKMVISEPQFDPFEEAEEETAAAAKGDLGVLGSTNSKFLPGSSMMMSTIGRDASSVLGGINSITSGGLISNLEGKLNPTRYRTVGETTIPGSNEEGYFEVAPVTLEKALLNVALEQKKWNWSELDDDKAWKMRTKWKNDWYP